MGKSSDPNEIFQVNIRRKKQFVSDDEQFSAPGRPDSQCPQVLWKNYITEQEDFPCEAAPSIFSASKIILLKTSTAV